ncbi:MAG: hypothetical protein ACM3TR_08645 [Caulobacteraceae bacterium]
MQGISLGQIVESTAGRDKNNKFVVLRIIDGQYVYISDGDLRKVEDPKKKKIKHLKMQNLVAQDIKDKLESNQKISNSEVRKFLKSII